MEADVRRRRDAGLVEHLSRPGDLKELEKAIRRLVVR
jgi:hypothetical protein